MIAIKRGFTLIEIMIVMAILAIILSAVSLASKPNTKRQLVQDAEYLGDVLDFIQQEAQARSQYLILTIDNHGIKTNANNANSNQNLLAKYRWSLDNIKVYAGFIQDKTYTNIWHRVITTEPIQNPYYLVLVKQNYQIQIRGDGSGQYKLSQVNNLNEN